LLKGPCFLVWRSQSDSRNLCLAVKRGEEDACSINYALVFLVIALIAGFLGFGGVAFAAPGIAKILFFIFLAVFVVSLILHLAQGSARV